MRRHFSALLVLLGSIVLSLLAAEWAARALALLEYPPAMNRGHPRRGYALRAGFEGESKYGIRLVINALGLRSPEVAIPKPPGVRRVMVLGDSVTFGAGVDEQDTFSRQLEGMLRDGDCPAEVVNAGVSGYGTVDEADVLENEGSALDPDVVLLYHIENDNQQKSPERSRVAVFLKDHVVYRSALVGASLYAYRTASWRIGASTKGGDRAAHRAEQRNWDQRPGTEASLAALRRIGDWAHERGAPVVIGSHPVGDDPSVDTVRNDLLRKIAGEQGMTFVDVRPTLRRNRDEDLHVSARDWHPNRLGHGLIAQALLPALLQALGCPTGAVPPAPAIHTEP